MLLTNDLSNEWEEFYEISKNEVNRIDKILTEWDEDIPYHPKDPYKLFKSISPKDVRVIILGQDPYPDPKMATGLAFDIPPSNKLSKSLINIFKELKRDLGVEKKNGDLSSWTKQGVMLLNTTLTYAPSNLHIKNKLWDNFFILLINYIHSINPNVIFMLWGEKAKKSLSKAKLKGDIIKLESHHPASYGMYNFAGCGHFSKVNKLLDIPINW